MIRKHFLLILSLFSIGILTSSMNLVKATNAQAPQKRVLVVDDEPVALMGKKQVVYQAFGSSKTAEEKKQSDERVVLIDTAVNATEALEKMRQNHYDLILTDGNMPGGDVDVLVRGLGTNNSIPILIQTGRPDDWRQNTVTGNLPIFDKAGSDVARLRAKIKEDLRL